MHQTNIVSVIGSPFESSWATTAHSSDGRIVAVVAIKGENAKNVGRELLVLIEKQSETSAKAIHNLCLDLLAQARKLEISIEMALVAFGNQPTLKGLPSIVLVTNQGHILLKRDQKVGQVLSSTNELKLVEGSIKENDELILATTHTEQLEQSIRQLFANDPSPDAFASNLRQKVKMLVDSSLFSLILIKILSLDLKSLSPSPSLAVLTDTLPEKNTVATIIEPETVSPAMDSDRTAKITQLANHWGIQPLPAEVELDDKHNQDEDAQIDRQPHFLNKSEATISNNLFVNNESDNVQQRPNEYQPLINTDPNLLKQEEPLETFVQANELPHFMEEETTKDIKIKIDFNAILTTITSQVFLWQKKLLAILPLFKKKTNLLLRHFQEWLKTKQIKTEAAQLQDNVANSAQENSALNPSWRSAFASTRFKQFAQKIKASIYSLLSSRFRSNSTIYLDKEKKSFFNLKKIRMILLFIILVLMAVFGVWTLVKNQLNKANQAIKPGRELLIQAQQIESANILQARELIIQASEIVKNNQSQLSNNWLQQRSFTQFYQELQEYSTQIDGQIEVASLNQFFDLREVQPEFLTSLISSNSKTLFFLDKERHQLAAIDKASKQTNLISLDPEPAVIELSATEEKLFLLQGGIRQIELRTDTPPLNSDTSSPESESRFSLFFSLPALIKSQGDSDRDGQFIESYETYLYVFNPEKRNIFRYLLRTDGLSEPVGWLINKQGLDFDQITSMAIDGNIWLTTQDGNILKYERGQKMEFEITGLEEPLGSSIRISTNPDAQNLYLLEPDKNRLVILTKSGEFVTQITSPTFASITQIAVDEKLAKLFGTTGSIVYEVDL